MGLMDKVKAQAEQAVAKAQEVGAQGQAKVNELQAKRVQDGLFRDLGEAYYAEQRSGGSHDAVQAALAALDAHESHPTGATSAQSGTPSGDFKLDD